MVEINANLYDAVVMAFFISPYSNLIHQSGPCRNQMTTGKMAEDNHMLN